MPPKITGITPNPREEFPTEEGHGQEYTFQFEYDDEDVLVRTVEDPTDLPSWLVVDETEGTVTVTAENSDFLSFEVSFYTSYNDEAAHDDPASSTKDDPYGPVEFRVGDAENE